MQTAPAEQLMVNLNKALEDQTLVGKSYTQGDRTFTVAKNDNFEYTDPIDGSITKKQVCYILNCSKY